MSKELQQIDLFGLNPTISNFVITDIKLDAGRVTGKFLATTEAADLAQLTPIRFADAYADAFLRLLGCDVDFAQTTLKVAYDRLQDSGLVESEKSNIVEFGR